MPDTLNYLIFGYAFGLGTLGLLVGSIIWRFRNLAADEATLAILEKEADSAKPAKQPASEKAAQVS